MPEMMKIFGLLLVLALTHCNVSTTSNLHDAATTGNSLQIITLLDEGEDVDARKTGGFTPLHDAARNNQSGSIITLLDKGANIVARDREGDTALHWAARRGHSDTINILLDRGTHIEIRNSVEATHTPRLSG